MARQRQVRDELWDHVKEGPIVRTLRGATEVHVCVA